MPKHKIHRYFSRLLLGKPYGRVHRGIDRPYKFLKRKHRKWFHSPSEAFLMGTACSRDAGGGTAGLLHVWLDKKCSEDKEFKRLIEFMEKQDAIMRRQERLWQKPRKKGRRKRRSR